MRIALRVATALLAAAASAMPVASAAASSSLTITATVLSSSNCKFRAGSGTSLDFGNIDPSGSTNATASVTLVVRCAGSANTATFSVTANDRLHSLAAGQRRMRHTVNTTEFLAYSLNTPVSATTPKNVDTNVVVTGTITPAQYANALGGSFADTLVLTLSP